MENDTRIVKSILAIGALNALAAGGSNVTLEQGREAILREAVTISNRLFELLFTEDKSAQVW
jgi:hypothetical protein